MTMPSSGVRAAFIAVATLALIAAAGLFSPAVAQTCSSDSFANAVDEAGAVLRKFNLEHQPKLNAKLETLRAKKGWKKTDSGDKALDYLQDGRIAELDARSNQLLTKIDNLGRAEDITPKNCASRLSELKAAGDELLAVMKEKSKYTLDKIDLELSGSGQDTAARDEPRKAVTAAPKPKPKPAPARQAKAVQKEALPPPQPKVQPLTPEEAAEARADASTPVPARPAEEWETSSEQAILNEPGQSGEVYGPYPDEQAGSAQGYSIDEIRDATRGFFGTISTSLASVIEYAFAKSGRPTAYVLGQEGGGAFLAGLRYGNGTLYWRAGGPHTQKVYWHGPSLGYDIGAEGSRTLFLIYKMDHPDQLYRAFTGVDGSAYVVGGVGLTLLKGGQVIMAPIRSGIGLRLGANLGYVRFTPEPTWNPF